MRKGDVLNMRGGWILNLFYKKIYGVEKYLKHRGVEIGENCKIYSDISTTESYLIKIGSNTTISSCVKFVTHDNSICKVLDDKTDIFGNIVIGKNCFIGMNSMILYGVTLADNTIVAAGSVVTKSVDEEGLIIGGNPARIIGRASDFGEKCAKYAVNCDSLNKDEKRRLIENAPKIVKSPMKKM